MYAAHGKYWHHSKAYDIWKVQIWTFAPVNTRENTASRLGYRMLSHFKKSSSRKPWVSKKIFSFSSVQSWHFSPLTLWESPFSFALLTRQKLNWSVDPQFIKHKHNEYLCEPCVQPLLCKLLVLRMIHPEIHSAFVSWMSPSQNITGKSNVVCNNVWSDSLRVSCVWVSGHLLWNWNNCLCPSRDSNCPWMRLA